MQWASRVNPALVRRLYETDARGIVDEELIDTVGHALYARCQSILQATEAHAGRVTSPECATLVVRASPPSDKDAILKCAGCGWRVRRADYFRTSQDKHLVGGPRAHLREALPGRAHVPGHPHVERREQPDPARDEGDLGSETRQLGAAPSDGPGRAAEVRPQAELRAFSHRWGRGPERQEMMPRVRA